MPVSVSAHSDANVSRAATSGFTWIGLQDFAEENLFVWAHSKEPAQPTFWKPGEPEDQNGEEDCVALHLGGWIDGNCEDSRWHFICELP